MANRLADAEIDSINPRTATRAIPAGLITKGTVWLFTIALRGTVGLAAWQLNPLAFALSPVALAVIMGYSYTKRFTALSHFWLGLSLSISPVGAWIAIQGSFCVATDYPLPCGAALDSRIRHYLCVSRCEF